MKYRSIVGYGLIMMLLMSVMRVFYVHGNRMNLTVVNIRVVT